MNTQTTNLRLVVTALLALAAMPIASALAADRGPGPGRDDRPLMARPGGPLLGPRDVKGRNDGDRDWDRDRDRDHDRDRDRHDGRLDIRLGSIPHVAPQRMVAGHYESRIQRVLVEPGHYETRTEQVIIREGRWEQRHIPAVVGQRLDCGRLVTVVITPGRIERVWVPPVYETRVTQVWCPPRYEDRVVRVWVNDYSIQEQSPIRSSITFRIGW